MGIIGVVAALTLPNLNSSTGEKEKVAKVKKIYSNLEDAYGRAEAVYGPFNQWNSNTTKVAGRLTEFMKLSKDCGLTSSGACFSNSVKFDVSSNLYVENGAFYKAILADGTSVSIGPYCTLSNYSCDSNNYAVYIDIDGVRKGANTVSKDVFAFRIKNNGEIVPFGEYYNENISLLTCDCLNHGGLTCTSWIVMNENMDYLKCPSKLSLTNTTCK